VAVGLLLGSVGAVTPPVPPERRAGGYVILAADFHVHGFLGDGALAPWALRDAAAHAGLDVFTLTNHNRLATSLFARWLFHDTPGPMVIVGEEVTARYHLIASGIEERVNWDQPPAQAIRDIHAQGGVAIAAHPGRLFAPFWDDEAIALLDGVERVHGEIHTRPAAGEEFARFYERVRRINPGVAAIGSSDFHFAGTPGWCRTYVLARDRSVSGVLDAVREGRTVAADAAGTLYGAAAWVGLVESAGGYRPAPEPPDRWRRTSMTMAWLGILGLVLLGGKRPR
jgi:predicted metal-dependent phosphoesterase TrpH